MDVNKILSGLASSGIASGLAGGVAGGLLTSALSGKGGKKVAKTALKAGGIAVVGGLAWKAYQHYRDRSQEVVTLRGSGELREADFERALDPVATPGGRWLLVQAMISAAMADGHIDPGEHDRLFGEVDKLDLSLAEKSSLYDELRHPKSVDDLAAQVGDQQTAVEVYAAALLAIDETRGEGAAYLAELASSLGLPRGLVESVHLRSEHALTSAA